MKFGMCVFSVFLAGALPGAEIVITTNATRTNLTSAIPVLRTNSFKGIQVKSGFRLVLAAAEPLVSNPGPMAFDENGRLFILETPDGQPGRVRLLEDTDGDGVFDSSRVYAENIYSPSAIACYGGGVFVGSAGEIVYLKDTKGDGQADMRRAVFSSFGDATNGANGVVVFTAIVWGVDNRFHVTTASRGDIISSSLPKQSVVLSAGGFSFDPRTALLSDESGIAPSGMSFDNRGRKFVSNPTQHLQLVMYESRYAARNPYIDMPDALVDVTERGAANVIYPARGGMQAPANFTSAAGLTFYRGYLFPPEYVENPFVADVMTGVVHRDQLRVVGLGLTAVRAGDETASEFLAMTDTSFRPVAFANGPDGALYMAGPAMEPVVSPINGKNTKTNAPVVQGFGRIYRIVPTNFKQPPPVQLEKAAVTNLVNALRHSNGWHRDSAARLLYERQDKASILPLIQLLYDPRSPPLGRMLALHALAGLQTLVPGHIVRMLGDSDERVREHAVLLSEKLLTNSMNFPDAVWEQLLKLPGDTSPQVRYQLAFTLGQCRNAGRVQTLADLLRSDVANRWMQAAVLSSLNEGGGEMLSLLAADGNFRNGPAGRDFLGRLAAMIGAKNQPQEIARAMTDIAALPEPGMAFFVMRRLGDGLQSSKSSLAIADPQCTLRPLYNSAARAFPDLNTPEAVRVDAVRLLDAGRAWSPQLSGIMIQQWPYLTTRLRSESVILMCSRLDRTATLLSALEASAIPRGDISYLQIKFLLAHPDDGIRRRAVNLFGNPASASRQNVVGQFSSAAHMTGSFEHGRALFIGRCAGCHQVGGDGNSSGLSLGGKAGMGKERMLVRILDPNSELPANNSAVLIVTKDGDTLAGSITVQNARSVTLCQSNGATRVVGRQNIQTLNRLGTAVMPDGLEAGLNQQDLADLLEFLCPSPAPAQ